MVVVGGDPTHFQKSVRSVLVPAAPPRSMVGEDASILSPGKPERTMASDSPARSLDEIDLSALRVNTPPPCTRVHGAVCVYVCARRWCAPVCPPSHFIVLFVRFHAPSSGCVDR